MSSSASSMWRRIFLFLYVICCVTGDENSDLEVIVKQGKLRGHRLTTRKGRTILAFQRIPYAKPPIGDLRFRSPQPPDPWNETLDASQKAPICIQKNIFTFDEDVSGDEDCLYVNVYTPQKDANFDVMVYFHGGGWLAGTGANAGPQLLLDHNLVLVTVNYRLGPIGFLSTGDSVCPGNNGMKDQVAALRWVRDNIEAFGGNPKSVTIFGESAGGASTHYHMLSPASQGLFHRVISESGTALGLWAIAPNGSTVHQAKKVALLLNCPTQPSKALLACLRRREASEIIKTDTAFMEWSIDPTLTFRPVLERSVGKDDEIFLPAHPLKLIVNASAVPWMTGVTSSDGAFVASRVFGKNLIDDMDANFETVGPLIMHYNEITKSDKKEVTKKLRDFYMKGGSMNRGTVPQVVNMFTDSWFLSGAAEAVKLHVDTDAAPVYYYYFDYRGTDSYSTLYGDSTTNYGVSHSDELLYILFDDATFPNRTLSENDEKMIDIMTSIWANFASTGNPTPDRNEFGAWPSVMSSDDPEYGHIKLEGVQIKRGLLTDRTTFWSTLPVRAKIPTLPKDEL